MRPISEDLRAAQRAAGVAWAVTGEVAMRGAFGAHRIVNEGRLLEEWEFPLAGPYFGAACACSEAGKVLHAVCGSFDNEIALRRVAEADLLGAGGIVTAFSVDELPVRHGVGMARSGSEIRLVFGDGPLLKWVRSLDDGLTWSGSEMTLYNGTGSYTEYSDIAVVGDSAGRWVVVYSAWTAGGQIRLRGAHGTGSGWSNWTVHTSTVDWRVAGAVASATTGLADGVTVFLYGTNYSWNSVAAGVVALTGGVFSAWWADQPAVIDRAGVPGEMMYGEVRIGRAAGGLWMVTRYGAAGEFWRYWVLAGVLDAGGGEYQLEEPQVLWTTDTALDVEGEVLSLVETAGSVYLLGGNCGVKFTKVAAAASAVTVLECEYRQRLNEGGVWRGRLALGADLTAGDLLRVTRTAVATEEDGTVVTGSDSRAFVVKEVWRSDRWVEVVALDGPGYMADHVLLRQKTLRAGDLTAARGTKALIGWSGVHPDSVSWLGSGELEDGFVARPGYTAWMALEQYGVDRTYIARPGRRDGEWVSVSLLQSESSPYRDIEDAVVNYLSFGAVGVARVGVDHPCGEYRQRLSEMRSVYVTLGLVTALDVSSGDAWAVWLSDESYGAARPAPHVRVDRGRPAWALEEITRAQRRRHMVTDALVWLRCPAHVGLELYDLALFQDATLYRVVAIKEIWRAGRLDQELELG